MRSCATQKPRDIGGAGGTAAQEAMRTELPEIAGTRDGHARWLGGRRIGITGACVSLVARAVGQQPIQRRLIEADHTEVELIGAQLPQLGGEQALVPG